MVRTMKNEYQPRCIPHEDKKYITCNAIEGDYHFIFECSNFTNYISKLYNILKDSFGLALVSLVCLNGSSFFYIRNEIKK